MRGNSLSFGRVFQIGSCGPLLSCEINRINCGQQLKEKKNESRNYQRTLPIVKEYILLMEVLFQPVSVFALDHNVKMYF